MWRNRVQNMIACIQKNDTIDTIDTIVYNINILYEFEEGHKNDFFGEK